MKLAGHIARHDDLIANKLLFWKPKHGHRNVGRPKITFVDMLQVDTGLADVEEVKGLMLNRELRRNIIKVRPKLPP